MTSDRFHISVNDKAYCTYKYRLPVADIKTIAVNKDVQYVNQIDHRSVFPSPYPLLLTGANNVDFSNDVPRHYKAGNY